MARKLGFEKITLRNSVMTATFITSKDSPFYQSTIFNTVLQFIQVYQQNVRMKEVNEKLSLTFRDVNTVTKAIQALVPLQEMVEANSLPSS